MTAEMQNLELARVSFLVVTFTRVHSSAAQ